MNSLHHIIFATALTLVGYSNFPQTERRLYVSPGIGIEGVSVRYSTKASVISKFGNEYGLVEHNRYSYEIRYDSGMSFYYRYDDPEQRIFSIVLRPDSHAFTSRGIVVGRSTLQDVFNAYGKVEFSTTSAEETWFAEYPGIEFHVEYKPTDKNLKSFDVDLLKRKIIEIDIESEANQ